MIYNATDGMQGEQTVIPNSHRAFIVRDLFQALGITLQQQDPTNLEGKTIYNISAPSTCPLKQEISIKYKTLDPETAKHCNFNIIGGQATGTYRFNTGFYGLTDMPAEFQKAIDITLANLTNTFSFLDDLIIVTKGGIQNHKEKLLKCLDKLEEEKLAINLEKCHFAKTKISWLGYEINKNGIKPIVSKTQAILNLQQPTTQKQLKSFLGSIHHLTKFIPNLAETCKDIRKLLQKETKFVWQEQHEATFNKIKDNIRYLTENTHFNINRKTIGRSYPF